MAKSKRRRNIKTNLIYTPTGTTTLPRPVSKSRSAMGKERSIMLESRREYLRTLPAATRAVANMLVVEHGAAPDEGIAPGYTAPWDDDMEWEDTQDDMPDISHEGSEYQDMYEHMLDLRRTSKRYSRIDVRTRRDRLRALQHNWDEQMPHLVNAYLQWKHGHTLPPDGLGEHTIFHITAIYSHRRDDKLSVPQLPNELANVALIRQGLLGCSPVVPSVALSLDTLELYHRLRRRHAQLSIQPMVRALCDLHDVTYSSVLREQFSIAFDVYLAILRRVKTAVDEALGHDSPEWRAKNACEVELHPARLLAMDGNNSAKRIAKAGTEDERTFKSDYFLSRDHVDQFKDEVKHRSSPPKPMVEDVDEDEEEDQDAPWLSEDGPGDASDGQARPTPCTQRWKASAAEHEKRALDVYETTGIFVCACRHGLIQKACEMIRSGELAKYPLAIVDWILDVHHDQCGCGYDIGCAFNETANNSAKVGPKLYNHPLYILGYGIEDLEGMERVFSSSNTVARCIRYASLFHYLQFLDLHFSQWDEDRYSELSRFLYNNYRQCLTIIKNYSVEVAHLKSTLGIDDSTIESWLQDERDFLKNLKDEPEDRVLECAYVQALIDRERAEQKLGTARDAFVSTSAGRAVDTQQDIRMTRRLERARRAAQEAAYAAIEAVNDLEAKLDIEHRWSPHDAKYQDILQFMRNRDFHRALEKALKARGKAIRSALSKYNSLAVQMQPPAPTLDWKDVVNYTFISEFDLLRHSHTSGNVTQRPWTVPYNREVAAKYWKIRGAYDEITRLNVEIPRLHTHIVLQRAAFKSAIQQTLETDPVLAAELRVRYRKYSRINFVHLRRIQAIARLPGFSGSWTVGTPADPRLAELIKTYRDDVAECTGTPECDDDVGEDDGSDDEAMVKLTELLEDFAVAG
ncbi:hypothetical protein CERSUDRAFT_97846 [Gelatoporia subvermispora B]|uniref:CxC1-like cysteine cluster associated with KDZ transposases domain-containing protein n=1 Tax=Ceriporiopsis subvermispora (strain B) TaxID=914234 RepID=M2R6P9_CERS8|nr:hypothetical protein CERSUDRAFT_97846 [Gelatoporia subvermispora B]